MFLLRVDEVGRALALGADLDYAAVLAGGRHHGLALQDIDADRLLDVDVRARPPRPRSSAGRASGPGVPIRTISRSFSFSSLAVIGVGAGHLLRLLALGHHLGGAGPARGGPRRTARQPPRGSPGSAGNRSLLPYQPQPMRATRRFFARPRVQRGNCPVLSVANPAAPVLSTSRRFMPTLLRK